MIPPRSARKINMHIFSLIGLVLISFASIFWVISLPKSIETYRSPLADTPPKPGLALGNPLTRRVVIVLIDALRYDTSTNATIMPFLYSLRQNAAYAVMHSQSPSFSEPGWATILTGAWPDINDSQIFNPPDVSSARAFTQDDIFTAAHRAGLITAVSGYAWFKDMLRNSEVDTGFYTLGEDSAADTSVVNNATPWLTANYQLILIHLDQVDYAGHHEGGPTSSNWNAAATRSDILLSQIVGKLDLNQDTLLVISDHGQIDQGGHGGPDPITLIEPFILTGAGIFPGNYENVNMVDVAPTLAVLLGTNIPASNQGHVLINMLAINPEQNATIQNALITQQTQLLSTYLKAIDSPGIVGGGEFVSAIQTAMKQAELTRKGSERVWRNVLAAFLAILPGYMLFLRKGNKALWLMGGAMIYVILFHLRYAIIDGRTYSLASIESAYWLISYVGITSFIALLLGWIVPMLGLNAFSSGGRKTINTTLNYVWVTIYFLALPILFNFAINGVVVSWSLPEWYTLFIGFLSLIQVLFVALLGLLLLGAVSVVGRLIKETGPTNIDSLISS
jgi:hypothetical protein